MAKHVADLLRLTGKGQYISALALTREMYALRPPRAMRSK